MTMKVTIVDRGLKAMVANVKANSGQFALDVGVHREQAEERTSINGESVSNADLALWHEFGNPKTNLPARPFLRTTMAENAAVYEKYLAQQFKLFLDSRQTLERAMANLGIVIVGDIRRKIIKGIPPALAATTLARKRRLGMPRPHVALYASGAMYNAIQARATRIKRK